MSTIPGQDALQGATMQAGSSDSAPAGQARAAAISREDLGDMLLEIADAAICVEEHLDSVDLGDPDDLVVLMRATYERIAYMGYIADRIASIAGLIQCRGGADEWLTPPPARPSSRVNTARQDWFNAGALRMSGFGHRLLGREVV